MMNINASQALVYPEMSAGALMSCDYHAFGENTRCKEALERIRQTQPRKDEIPYVYVTDDNEHVRGVVRLTDLFRSHPEQTLGEIARRHVVSVRATDDQEAAVRVMRHYDLKAVPVLDEEQHLLGVITADRAMAAQSQEISEDMFRSVGILNREATRSDLLVRGSVWRIWWVRVPFLLITLAGGMLAGAVIGVYQEALEAVVALAFFFPVIMDMGGNAAVQSTTVLIRGYVLGQIDLGRFHRHLLREFGIGLVMGPLLGIPAGIIAGLWQGAELGLVVGLAMTCTLALATLLGFLVPFVLIKLGKDPAAGSDPLITMIKDITGLLIYFFFAYQILGYLF